MILKATIITLTKCSRYYFLQHGSNHGFRLIVSQHSVCFKRHNLVLSIIRHRKFTHIRINLAIFSNVIIARIKLNNNILIKLQIGSLQAEDKHKIVKDI